MNRSDLIISSIKGQLRLFVTDIERVESFIHAISPMIVEDEDVDIVQIKKNFSHPIESEILRLLYHYQKVVIDDDWYFLDYLKKCRQRNPLNELSVLLYLELRSYMLYMTDATSCKKIKHVLDVFSETQLVNNLNDYIGTSKAWQIMDEECIMGLTFELQIAVNQYPEKHILKYWYAESLLLNEKYQEAICIYRQFIDAVSNEEKQDTVEPEHITMAWWQLGRCYVHTETYRNAMDCYSYLININPPVLEFDDNEMVFDISYVGVIEERIALKKMMGRDDIQQDKYLLYQINEFYNS